MSVYFGNKKVSPLIVQDKQQIDAEVQLALAGGNQEVIAPNNYLYYKVTIVKPATLVSNNVRKGVTIAGVVGTMEERKEEEEKTINISANNTYTVIPTDGKTLSKVTAVVTVSPTLQSKSITPSTVQQIVKPDASYQGLSQVIVYKAPTESVTITPTKGSQTVQPSEGNVGFSDVTVEAIPDDYIIPSGTIQITENGTYNVAEKANAYVNVSGVDTSDATAVATDILSGKTAYAKGSKITGTIETYSGTFEKYTPKTLEESTWTEIALASSDGTASSKWQVGDEKTVTLTSGEQLTLQILDFNHDVEAGDYDYFAGITFGTKYLLNTRYKMNSSKTTAGGWNSSEMRTSTLTTILSQLPSELQELILTVSKKSMSGNLSQVISTSADKLFLLSEVEVTGTTEEGFSEEGSQYKYWQMHNTDSDRMKKPGGAGSSEYWWLRTPSLTIDTAFRAVTRTGSVANVDADYTIAYVCFGFCV